MRVETVAMAVMIELLNIIASKLEHGDDPDELARYIRSLIAAAERPGLLSFEVCRMD
jgi:hypothetical protein